MRVDPVREDSVRVDPVHVDFVRVDPVQGDSVRVDPVRVDSMRMSRILARLQSQWLQVQHQDTVFLFVISNEC